MIALVIQLLIVALVLLIVWYVVRLMATTLGAPPVVIQLVGLVFLLVFVLIVLRSPLVGLHVWP